MKLLLRSTYYGIDNLMIFFRGVERFIVIVFIAEDERRNPGVHHSPSQILGQKLYRCSISQGMYVLQHKKRRHTYQ
jgi:hypothetical protein